MARKHFPLLTVFGRRMHSPTYTGSFRASDFVLRNYDVAMLFHSNQTLYMDAGVGDGQPAESHIQTK